MPSKAIQKSKPKAYISDKIYLPADHVRESLVKKEFDRRIFVQNMCNNCQIFKDGDRFCDICSTCDGYKGRFKTYELTSIKNEDYFGVPSGDVKAVEKALQISLNDFDIEDKRANTPVKYPLKFTGSLYTGKEIINGYHTADQVDVIKQFAKHKRGIIISPARSGKTVMAAYIYCKSKKRTLYIVHNSPLLKQFYRTLLKTTNLREMRQKTGKKIVGIIQSEKDWKENWDCVLVTYQKFISDKGKERLQKYVVGRTAQIIVDEIHRGAARAYIDVLNNIDAKRKIGFTATINRKDGQEIFPLQIIGPVVAQANVEMRPPHIVIIPTDLKPEKDFKGRTAYVYINKWLANNRKRNILLLKHIFNDLRANPLHSIVIPVMRRDQCLELAKMINRQAEFNNANKNEKWPEELAVPYLRGINIEQTLDKARSGEAKVVVAMRSMMKEGLDVPLWTHIYMQIPVSNYSDTYQITQRVCTPYEGKPASIIKVFIDQIGLCLGCFRNTYQHMLKMGYLIDEENKQLAQSFTQRKKQTEELSGWI